MNSLITAMFIWNEFQLQLLHLHVRIKGKFWFLLEKKGSNQIVFSGDLPVFLIEFQFKIRTDTQEGVEKSQNFDIIRSEPISNEPRWFLLWHRQKYRYVFHKDIQKSVIRIFRDEFSKELCNGDLATFSKEKPYQRFTKQSLEKFILQKYECHQCKKVNRQ